MGEVFNATHSYGRYSVGVGTDVISGVQRTTIQFNDGFSPLSLFTGGFLGGFYDISDLTTLFQDSAGTTPVTASGQPVGKILDKSGNGNHLTQPTAGSRPLYNYNLGISSLSFDGIDDKLIFPIAMLTGWTSGFGLAAGKLPVDPPIAGNGPILGFFANGGAAEFYPFTDGIVQSSFLNSARKNCGDPGNMAAWHIGDFRSQANDFRAGFNAVDYSTTGVNTVAVTTGVAGYPSLGDNGFGQFFLGNCGPIVVINKFLSISELASVRTWAGTKIGLTI